MLKIHQNDIGPELGRKVRRRLPVLGPRNHANRLLGLEQALRALTKRPLSSAMSTVRGLELMTY
jgi:hypothetical protein